MSGTGRRSVINPLLAGFAAGVLIALVVGLMAVINLTYGAPWAPSHTISAQVTDADGMSAGSDVRIAGRLVGQVVTVQAAGDHTNITFHVDAGDWPLPRDTSASVRLATLLGQKYIQLNPGHSSQPMADGAVIGLKSTHPVVDFDQILDTFDKPTRESLTSLIRTVAGAVQGQEGTVQQLIPDLSDLSVHSNVPTQELATRNTEINNILINLGVAADQLNASRDDFAGVIDNLNAVTANLAKNEGRALTGFIHNTDTLNLTTDAVLGRGFAKQLDSGLQQLGTFATELNKLLVVLIPQTRSFGEPLPACPHPPAAHAAAVCTESSDIVFDNPLNCFNPGAAACGTSAGIPVRSGIDLIYEITTATSQGVASHNYGTATAPNIQYNSFLRQSAQGFEKCLFEVPTPCTWGQTSGAAAATAAPGTSTAPSAVAPLPAPALIPAPSLRPVPRPSAGPTPTPSWSPLPSPSWSPLPTPRPAAAEASASPATQTTGYDVPLSDLGGDLNLAIWNVLFAPWYSG
jgi:virulence factor Mce-like protein